MQPICGSPNDSLGTIFESYDFWYEDTPTQLKAIRRVLLNLTIAAQYDRIVKGTGDGLVQHSNQCTSRFCNLLHATSATFRNAFTSDSSSFPSISHRNL
jgi:hypothetical protein